jgi:hypothetical protein
MNPSNSSNPMNSINSSNPSNSSNFSKLLTITRQLIAMSLIALALTSCSGGKMEPTTKITLPSIKDVPAEAWQKLSQKKVYFGHQSVGNNIMDGIKDLMKENPQIKLNIVETDNPSDFNAPVFAHSPIGKNMDPTSKYIDFSEKMTGGLGNKLDIAFFKFCYIDITAATDAEKVFTGYRNSLSLTKKSFPNTTIIHVTTPLRVIQASGPRTWLKTIIGRPIGGYNDNMKREQFNAILRKEYSGKEPIFDLAAIESTNPDGSRFSFTQDGKTGYALVPAYTNDGGHLNEQGRKLVAEQLLIFLSKL